MAYGHKHCYVDHLEVSESKVTDLAHCSSPMAEKLQDGLLYIRDFGLWGTFKIENYVLYKHKYYLMI